MSSHWAATHGIALVLSYEEEMSLGRLFFVLSKHANFHAQKSDKLPYLL